MAENQQGGNRGPTLELDSLLHQMKFYNLKDPPAYYSPNTNVAFFTSLYAEQGERKRTDGGWKSNRSLQQDNEYKKKKKSSSSKCTL